MAAGIATIEALSQPGVYEELERKSAAFYSMGIAPADEQKFDRVMEAITRVIQPA